MHRERARADYERDGHVHLEAVLRPDVLLQLRAALVTHFLLNERSDVAVQPFEISKIVPIARDVMRHEFLMHVARWLLRAERVRVWHDQVIIRPPRVGADSGWHQDLAFWPMKAPTALTCWIPLHDVNGVTGCLRFLRGSHQWGNRPSIVPRALEDIVGLAGDDAAPPQEVFELPMQFGDCDFHHGLVFHGAHPNTSDSYRITYKVIYMDVESELGPDVYAAATA